MSAPSNLAASSATKRRLEDPSSPTGTPHQSGAKRLALDKLVKDDDADSESSKVQAAPPELARGVKDVKPDVPQNSRKKDSEGDVILTDAPANQEPQPIQSTSGPSGHSTGPFHQQDETNWLHVRACINTAEAATVIGKGGDNVQVIRNLSGARCTVSDYARGAVERILTVSGPVDAVSKAFGLIIRTINEEPLEEPSDVNSKEYVLRLLIPSILIGSIIGKGGRRIREIQEASGVRANASDSNLPLSSERFLIVTGVADAAHIAIYYVAQTLVEQLTERFGGPAASAYATRNGGPANAATGGMQVVPYTPLAVGGLFGHPKSFARQANNADLAPANPYGMPYHHGQVAQQNPQQNAQYGAGSPHRNTQYGQASGQTPAPYVGHAAQSGAHASASAQPTGVPGPLTQQIYIPNDMVGAIIGKGGSKINEIRQLSGSIIKINEPQDNSNERLVTITGTQEHNQIALYMLYSRLESEKHRI